MDKNNFTSISPRRNATFLSEYTMSVIVGRALPDAKMALNLSKEGYYLQYELGLTPDRPFRNVQVVGDVLGKYHPGDQAVYDALLRLMQNFQLNILLWMAMEILDQ